MGILEKAPESLILYHFSGRFWDGDQSTIKIKIMIKTTIKIKMKIKIRTRIRMTRAWGLKSPGDVFRLIDIRPNLSHELIGAGKLRRSP